MMLKAFFILYLDFVLVTFKAVPPSLLFHTIAFDDVAVLQGECVAVRSKTMVVGTTWYDAFFLAL